MKMAHVMEGNILCVELIDLVLGRRKKKIYVTHTHLFDRMSGDFEYGATLVVENIFLLAFTYPLNIYSFVCKFH